MRTNYISYLLILCTILFVACDDFLDVHPKTEVEGTDLFDSEDGFEDALNGLYIKMTSTSLYGRELTFGFLDVIGNCYYDAGIQTYSYAKAYDYANSDVENIINNIWIEGYNIIANANSLIENIQAKDPSFFSDGYYNLIYGEALGIRAFMHLDLLRLYAPSLANDPEAIGIPYVTDFSYNRTPSSSVTECLDLILQDLTNAEALLSEVDPVYLSTESNNRYFYMNYYAVRALMAQAYLWKGDNQNALLAAQDVINSAKYNWTASNELSTSSDESVNRTFTPETIFALQSNQIENNILGYLYGEYSDNTAPIFATHIDWLASIFPNITHSTDLRYNCLFEAGGSEPNYLVSTKLWQKDSGGDDLNEEFIQRMPLIRLPEMYLICAEADIDNAAQYLNVIRHNRGVEAEVVLNTAPELYDEILLEYYREYITEGKLFYYCKRHNRQYIGGRSSYNLTAEFDTDNYTLPIPQQEIEYGNR